MSVMTLHILQHEATFTSPAGRLVPFEVPQEAEKRVYYLVLPPAADISLLEIGQDTSDPPEYAVGRLISNEGGAILASLVDGCVIETALDSQKTMPLEKSAPGEWYYIQLRPRDTIRFNKHSFTCSIKDQAIATPSGVHLSSQNVQSVSQKVQVKSSHPVSAHHRTVVGDHDVYAASKKETAVTKEAIIANGVAKEDPQIYSTAREGTPAGVSRSDEAQHNSVARSGAIDTEAPNATSMLQQVLETPVKHRALPNEHDSKTPTLLQLEAVNDENKPLETQPLSHKSKNIINKTSRSEPEQSVLSLSRATPDLPTQQSAVLSQTSNVSGKLKRVRSTPNEDDAANQRPNAKRARAATKSQLSSIPTQPVTTHQLHGNTSAQTLPRNIMFTSSMYKDDTNMQSWLKNQGFTVIQDMPDLEVEYTCVVGDDELPRTSKLLRSLVRGATIVSDEWLTSSVAKDKLFGREEFQPPELNANSDLDRKSILDGKRLFVTSNLQSTLKTGWKEFMALVQEIGAISIDHGGARKLRDYADVDNTIFFGTGSDDAQAQQIAELLQCQIYNKDLLKESVVRGELLTGDETFKIDFSVPPSTAKKGRKK